MQFLDILDSSLSEAEMGELCRRFGVAYGAFPGRTRRDKTREFLGYIRRQGRMSSLAEATVALRPDLLPAVAQLYESKEKELDWLDQVAGGEGKALESGLTWRWSASSGSRPGQGSAADTPVSPDVVPELDPPLPVVPVNPYTPGVAVVDAAMFFGRAAELEQIHQKLVEGKHVAIVAGRGFGGSSLLYQARQRFSDGARLPAYIDMKEPAHQSMAGLLNAIWTQWWAQVKPGNAVVVQTLAEFVTAVRKLGAAGFRPLLFLDELEQLVWRRTVFTDDLLNAWHEIGREGLVGFVMTSHTAPADLLAQEGFASSFYELFHPLNLGLMDEPSARGLLRVPIERVGITVPDESVERLLALAGPHPFFLQIAGLYLFESLSRDAYSGAEVTRQFEAAAEPYWQDLWETMSPLARSHYPLTPAKAMEGMGGRQMRILANRGLVLASESEYRPFSEGFARWLRRMEAAMQAAASALVEPASV